MLQWWEFTIVWLKMFVTRHLIFIYLWGQNVSSFQDSGIQLCNFWDSTLQISCYSVTVKFTEEALKIEIKPLTNSRSLQGVRSNFRHSQAMNLLRTCGRPDAFRRPSFGCPLMLLTATVVPTCFSKKWWGVRTDSPSSRGGFIIIIRSDKKSRYFETVASFWFWIHG